MARFLLPYRRSLPLLKTLTPSFPSRPFLTDPRPVAFDENLLRILRAETTYLTDYRPPCSPPPSLGRFSIEDRPGEQWVRLRTRHARTGTGEDEDVKVEATMFDGAAPIPPAKKAVYEGEVRLHVSLIVEVSKGEGADSVMEFICSAWPDKLEVEKIFPLGRRAAAVRPYMGRDFKKLEGSVRKAVVEYLEERGVDDDLAEFLHEYMANKDKAELLRWMRTVQSFVEK